MNFNDAVFDKMLCAHGGFNIVANFSANKHVRSEKDVYSVEALLENNVLRARKLLRLLEEFPPRPMAEIDALLGELTTAFGKPDTTKAEIVTIMKRFLRNFDHEEKGLYLDSKM